MRIFYALSFFLALLTPQISGAQVFKVYDNFSELEERIAQAKSTTLLVINFWATFCKPCLEELPYFNQLHAKYASPDFEVILVSLDFKSHLEKKLIPYLRANPLSPEIILLADPEHDEWIRRVDGNWLGAIPATLLIRGKERDFYAGEFEQMKDLEDFIFRFYERIGVPPPTGITN